MVFNYILLDIPHLIAQFFVNYDIIHGVMLQGDMVSQDGNTRCHQFSWESSTIEPTIKFLIYERDVLNFCDEIDGKS